MSYYKADVVRASASGMWLSILGALAPQIQLAIEKLGKHIACPVHGGKDGFRLFKDADKTGGGVCNTCGTFPDGFELLMWAKKYSFKMCLEEVGTYLGVRKENSKENHRSLPEAQFASQERVRMKSNVQNTNRRSSFKGILIQHGAAPYGHCEKNEDNYFVLIRDNRGQERTIWSIDLGRAIFESGAQHGDAITLTHTGRKEVTVMSQIKDSQGRVVREQPIQTHRNTWAIEVQDVKVVHSANSSALHTQVNGNCINAPVSEPKSKVYSFSKEETRLSQEELDNRKKEVKVEKVWNECLPYSSMAARPMHLYFQNRQLLVSDDVIEKNDCLRFHPSMPYYDDGKEVGKYPAIVCAIRDVEGKLVTLHRTYLTEVGKKAKVENVKKMMPVPDGMSVKGAAIRLGEPVEGVLGVAEGLETALSAYRISRYPVWSTVNASLMESFEIPIGIHTVLIWADLDKSCTGEVSANVLKTRLEKQSVQTIIILPRPPFQKVPSNIKGIDWNDVLLGNGRFGGFPCLDYLRSFIKSGRAKYACA